MPNQHTRTRTHTEPHTNTKYMKASIKYCVEWLASDREHLYVLPFSKKHKKYEEKQNKAKQNEITKSKW